MSQIFRDIREHHHVVRLKSTSTDNQKLKWKYEQIHIILNPVTTFTAQSFFPTPPPKKKKKKKKTTSTPPKTPTAIASLRFLRCRALRVLSSKARRASPQPKSPMTWSLGTSPPLSPVGRSVGPKRQLPVSLIVWGFLGLRMPGGLVDVWMVLG